ncbi:leucine-rich repeat-containing protein 66 [Spea bombifrons]|uniref:leucine-rich repeat-containing protein 66 n=1 Tax=Spea bombifrons TaxID=233779 RepID=UPI002349B04F|nr:leucine-rich repeat-containing protein 66 [Spea bombifrons]
MGKMWNVTCNSPPRTKGQHLIAINFPSTCVKPMDSTNARPEMIVAGKETVLSCDVPDSFGTHKVRWWTPKGWIFEDDQYSTHYIDHMKNLVLTLPDRSDEGFYICVSDVTQNRILYQVYVRTGESVPIRRTRNTLAERAQGRTQGEFTVAVCLSVIITFIGAFCLGLFARPFIENLWKKQCKPRCSKKQNSTTVYDNEGFTDERDWCSTHEYVGKNKSRDASETESSSGSSITHREDKVAVNVTGNHLEDSESQELYHANPTLPKSEENITRNHQCSRDIPAHTSSQLQRRGTYTITDDNDQGSDGEIVTLNAGLHKTKDGTAWNTDKLLYENLSPQLTPKSEATINIPAAPTTITEIVKSPKTLFSSRNSPQSPSPETTQEGAAHHADDDMPTAENHKPLSTRHSGSIQNKQYSHTAVVHKRNRERITTSSDTSSTDDGSIFSFSISNSLSETTDFPDLPSDDEKVDVQQHSTAEVPGGNMMPSHSAGEHASDSSSNLSTPTVSRQTTPTPTLTKESEMKQKTVSDLSKSQSNKGTDNHLAGSDLDASNLYDKTNIQPKDTFNYSSDNLSDTSSSSKKSEGNSEVVINHDWSQRSNNKIHLDRATDYSDLSTSSEYTAEFPDVPQHLQIPTNDVTDAGQNPCKNEAVLYWLETANGGNATNESLIPPVISNREDLLITTSAKEDLLNINSHEGKTMQTVADSSDTLNITQPKTYKNVEYDANTKTPFMGLDKYIGGSVNPLPVYMQMEAPTTKSTDNSGAYFVKRRKVFDAFSASLNTGENLI